MQTGVYRQLLRYNFGIISCEGRWLLETYKAAPLADLRPARQIWALLHTQYSHLRRRVHKAACLERQR